MSSRPCYYIAVAAEAMAKVVCTLQRAICPPGAIGGCGHGSASASCGIQRGFPALLSIVSAIGLGFIVRDAILIPLLLVFLAATLLGPYLGTRRHHEPWSLVLGGRSALAITAVILGFVRSAIPAYVGIVGLIVASILNVWLRTRQLGSR